MYGMQTDPRQCCVFVPDLLLDRLKPRGNSFRIDDLTVFGGATDGVPDVTVMLRVAGTEPPVMLSIRFTELEARMLADGLCKSAADAVSL